MDNDTNEDERHELAEQERIIATATAAATKRRHLKISSVLERKGKFPLRNRNKIDVLVKEFLENLGDDIHDMLCDNDVNSDNYCGLDSSRDTEEEAATAIRFFPELLSRRKIINISLEVDDDEEEEVFTEEELYPIQYLAYSEWQCNAKAAYFVPLIARLAAEFGSFEEEERGGLLCVDDDENENVLQNLMRSDHIECHEPIDSQYLQALIRLRKNDLLKKEDIQRYDLLNKLSRGEYCFAEKRFRFLVEWDPSALVHYDETGWLPLHEAAYYTTIQGFRSVFEAGIRYFPEKKGINLLFMKRSNNDDTPFQHACVRFGYEQVMKFVEETLFRYYSSDNTTHLNIVEEALLTATIDENVRLDCVYFLMHREPDMLQKLLSSTPAAATRSSYNYDGNENDKVIDGSSNTLVKRALYPSKKRKRELRN
jgi:hypothetical protein